MTKWLASFKKKITMCAIANGEHYWRAVRSGLMAIAALICCAPVQAQTDAGMIAKLHAMWKSQQSDVDDGSNPLPALSNRG